MESLASISHLAVPPVGEQVSSELLILLGKVILGLVLDEEEGQKDTDQSTNGGNEESPPFAQVGLNWGEAVCE